MKKRTLIVTAFCMIVSICFVVTGCSKTSGINLQGTIVSNNPVGDEMGADSIIMLDLSTGEIVKIADTKNAREPRFSAEGDKVLCKHIGEFLKTSIREYNHVTGESTIMFEPGKYDEGIRNFYNAKYVPNSDNISFYSGESIYLYDIKTGEPEKIVDRGNAGYFWYSDGDNLLIDSDNMTICKVNIKTKEEHVLITEGMGAVLSANDRYICYIKVNYLKVDEKWVMESSLNVRDMETGEEWECEKKNTLGYVFSPDSNYIAIVQEGKTQDVQEMIVWDYRNDKKQVVMEKINFRHIDFFDWKQ